jgi:N-acetylneuraminate lyase
MLIEGFKGVYPALVSPKDDSGRLSEERTVALIDHLYEADVHGLYLCGNTGEGYLMSVDARKRLAEVAVDASKGRGKVIVHVGAPAETDAVDLAKHAKSIGADGVSSLPPYVQGYAFEEHLAFYTQIAYAADLPTFVYYIPVITKVEFTLAEMDQLLEIEGVEGLKFTNHNLYLMEGILNSATKPHVFNGHDEVFLAGMAMGAHAGIGTYYNLMPRAFVGIYDAFGKGNLDQGRAHQHTANELIRTCQQFRQNAAVHGILKMQGVDCGDPIRPARPLDAEGMAALKKELQKAGLLEVLGIGAE